MLKPRVPVSSLLASACCLAFGAPTSARGHDVTMDAPVSDEPRPVRVEDLYTGLSDPFWATPAARAVLTLFDDDALRQVLVPLAARISQIYANEEEAEIDMRSPLPDRILLPVSTFGAVFGLPFSRAVSAACRAGAEEDDVGE